MAKRKRVVGEDAKEKKLRFEKVAYNLEELPVEKFLKDNFLPYAWSFNLDRAMVDVSGLKPVQRRILYTMYKDGLSPNANRSKVATLAGEVLTYHPHGNAAVEEALKNLARPHVFRVPLIDYKGSVGGPGQPGAAARYLEARLSKAAWLNVEEISDHAVPMVANYDGTTEEPLKIPVRWPVSVINGGSGIAIAYAANMPSHNPTEVMNACKMILDNPEATHKDVQQYIKGPDFNMGGVITANDGIISYMETGSGTFKIRGNYEVTPGPRSTHRIEFYEIPFGTNPQKILEEFQKQSEKGQFKEIATLKDLSDMKHPIRIIIETKPSVNYKKVIQDLFKYTSLESSFAANITTIVDNQPKQSSMLELLQDFIKFRMLCVRNKASYSLPKRRERLHIVEGLLLTLLDIDKAISIIRESDDVKIANQELQKSFNIDEKQAEHVLSLQLRRLTKMDKVELDEEKEKIIKEIERLNSLLHDDVFLRNHLQDEFTETLKVIGSERNTEINGISQADFVAQEKSVLKELKREDRNLPCYVTRFANGLIMKTEEPFNYELPLVGKIPHSPILESIKVRSQDHIVLVSSDGIAHRIPLSYLQFNTPVDAKNAGISLNDGVELVALAKDSVLKIDVGLLLATRLGEIKLVRPDLPARDEYPVYALSEGDSIVSGRWISRRLAGNYIVSVTSGSNILIYDATSLRAVGAPAGGVKSQKLREGEEVISVSLVNGVRSPDSFVISQSNTSVKMTMLKEISPKNKGSMGVVLQKFGKNETKLIGAYAYSGQGLIASVKGGNSVFNLPPITSRATRGSEFPLPLNFGIAITDEKTASNNASEAQAQGEKSSSETTSNENEININTNEENTTNDTVDLNNELDTETVESEVNIEGNVVINDSSINNKNDDEIVLEFPNDGALF